MASKNYKSIIFLWLLFILLVSCQTMPMPDTLSILPDDASHVPLDDGAELYIFAHAKEARSIIDLLPLEELKDKQAKQMLSELNL